MKAYRWTLDVVAVAALTLLADAVVLVLGVEWPPLRTAVLLPVVLVLPGYVLVGVMYPQVAPDGSPASSSTSDGRRGIDGVERFGLSLAASLAIVPMVAFALNFTPAGIRADPILLAVSWFTLIFALLTLVRRLSVPADRRFRIPPLSRVGEASSRYFGAGRGSLSGRQPFQATTGSHRLLNLVLAASVLVLVASVAYAAVAPSPGNQHFTEYYLVEKNGTGNYTTADLPHQFAAGQGTPLSVAIKNHEGQDTTYTTVVLLQQTDSKGGTTRVVNSQELDRFTTQVPDGGTHVEDVTLSPTQSGQHLKLTFLLYKGKAPANPTAENAYLETHLYVNVGGGSG